MKRLNKILLVLSCLVLSSSLLIAVGHSSWNYAVNDTSLEVEKKVYAVVFNKKNGTYYTHYSDLEYESYFEMPELVTNTATKWCIKSGDFYFWEYSAYDCVQFSSLNIFIVDYHNVSKLPSVIFQEF